MACATFSTHDCGCKLAEPLLRVEDLRVVFGPPGREQVAVDGVSLTLAPGEVLGIVGESVRGKEISMIFQEPMSALNPVFKVGEQISETLRVHDGLSRARAREGALHMLERVGISNPEQRLDQYPHELSGGMRQRIMIAIALACRPKLLIADEPTTALDVTIQAQILELLVRLQSELGMAILLITHNLGLVADVAHRVNVMYA